MIYMFDPNVYTQEDVVRHSKTVLVNLGDFPTTLEEEFSKVKVTDCISVSFLLVSRSHQSFVEI